MRKRLCVALIAFLAVLGLSAEVHYQPHICIGGRAGLSMAGMSFSPTVKQGWNMGSAGAVTFRYTEEKLFGFVVEAGWAQRGWKENFEELPFEYSRTATYLTVPFLTHIYFGTKRFKMFFNAGPSVSYLLGESTSANFDYHDTASIADFPRTRRTEQLYTPIKNKFDYGISVGMGFEFYLNPRNSVVVEGRFYYGLGNIYPSSKADTFSASRCMNIEVTAGYNFRLK